jgi:hypothetical protein
MVSSILRTQRGQSVDAGRSADTQSPGFQWANDFDYGGQRGDDLCTRTGSPCIIGFAATQLV